MDVMQSRVDGRPTIALDGELDIATAPDLSEALDSAIESDPVVVLDLTECTFIDSSGLRVLIQAAQSLSADGHKLVIAGLNGQPKDLFKLTALDHGHLFEIRTF